jgi:hypothetical protein
MADSLLHAKDSIILPDLNGKNEGSLQIADRSKRNSDRIQ